MFNITSKYFSFFNNTSSASLIAHITRNFLTCYSCLCYSSMYIATFNDAVLMQWCIQNTIKHLRLSFLQNWLKIFSSYAFASQFLQKTASYFTMPAKGFKVNNLFFPGSLYVFIFLRKPKRAIYKF